MISDDQIRGGVSAPPQEVLILGVGNLLLKDDGFGVHLINALQDTAFPKNVKVMEAGTVSHQLIPLFHEIDYLIIIDVVEANDTPGSLFRFAPEDMKYTAEQRVSLHQISLIDVLHMTELPGRGRKQSSLECSPRMSPHGHSN